MLEIIKSKLFYIHLRAKRERERETKDEEHDVRMFIIWPYSLHKPAGREIGQPKNK